MHNFTGKWITDKDYAGITPVQVFHRQLDGYQPPVFPRENDHILFRRRAELPLVQHEATLNITADDFYKLYINGRFVAEGPARCYPHRTVCDVLDVAPYLKPGENVFAFHTYYQGLINRVWVSGDGRHGLLCDLVIDGKTLLSSDETFLTAKHTGYAADRRIAYNTQFNEIYDARVPAYGFASPDYDDSNWTHACINKTDDHTVTEEDMVGLTHETIYPVSVCKTANGTLYDFGAVYVGHVAFSCRGKRGEKVTVLSAQELTPDGEPLCPMRCNCDYEDALICSGGIDQSDYFDYKTFRYVKIIGGTDISDVRLIARHRPFTLCADLRPEYRGDKDLEAIWTLCVESIKWGVQDAVLDCMDREKGFYIGDGCYSSLTHMILTHDTKIARKLIDDAYASSFISEGLLTCPDSSFPQEIAEFPLMLCDFLLWYTRMTNDLDYLSETLPKAVSVLECYRKLYEKDGLLKDLDRWCIVEWPQNFRDGYAVDIREHQVCHEPHVVMNAHYLEAIGAVNRMADMLNIPRYRDTGELYERFLTAFYDEERHLFRDGLEHDHASYVGNLFPFAYGLCPDDACRANFLAMADSRGVTDLGVFGPFAYLLGMVRAGKLERIRAALKEPGAWLKMISEGATRTFEAWGKDCKWNASLFHMTQSATAIFLADIDLPSLFA